MFVLREDDPIKQLKITFNRIADPLLLYAVEAANHLAESWFTIWTSTGAANTAGSVTLMFALARSFSGFCVLEFQVPEFNKMKEPIPVRRSALETYSVINLSTLVDGFFGRSVDDCETLAIERWV